jgi:hypothetical protein
MNMVKPKTDTIKDNLSQISPNEEKLVRSVDEINAPDITSMKKIIIAVYIALLLLGVGTGYLLTKTAKTSTKTTTSATQSTSKAVGSTDTQTFKDSAQGTLEKGGSDGEGTHKLIRDGGPSQTVYLISSVVDLDLYAGKKVKVWGQTQAAKSVAWLMDVGKIEQSE